MRRPILAVGMLVVATLLAGAVIRSYREGSGGMRNPVSPPTKPIDTVVETPEPTQPVTPTIQKKVAPGKHVYTFETQDGERRYVVHVPTSYDGTKALPVLLHLHGGLGTAESSDTSTSFSALAEERGFLLVYGEGTKGRISFTSWNAGGCCGQSQEKNNNVDDVRYVREVLTQVQEKFQVHQNHIYVSGMSNGSMLANRLACEIPELIAGVATVSGTTQVSQCDPTRALPHIIIHGTADDNVPYYGGKSGSPLNSGTFAAVEDEFKTWAKRNGCSGDIVTTSISSEGSDGTSVDKLSFASCPKGKEVVLYRVNGGKHAWPGGRAGTNKLELSKPSQGLKASEAILDFFGF